MEIKDLKDRLDKRVITIKDFEQFHNRMWKIKGKVSIVEFSETNNLENGEVSKGVELNLEDYSGKISIAAFDKYAELFNETVVVDAE